MYLGLKFSQVHCLSHLFVVTSFVVGSFVVIIIQQLEFAVIVSLLLEATRYIFLLSDTALNVD